MLTRAPRVHFLVSSQLLPHIEPLPARKDITPLASKTPFLLNKSPAIRCAGCPMGNGPPLPIPRLKYLDREWPGPSQRSSSSPIWRIAATER
jgi:hypothetical protein